MQRWLKVLLALVVAATALGVIHGVSAAPEVDRLHTEVALKELQVDGLKLDLPFSTYRIGYSAVAAPTVQAFRVRPVALDPTARLTVNGAPVGDGGFATVGLADDLNIVRIALTSGNLERQYILLVTRRPM